MLIMSKIEYRHGKDYGIVSDILSQSRFISWDVTRKMIILDDYKL